MKHQAIIDCALSGYSAEKAKLDKLVGELTDATKATAAKIGIGAIFKKLVEKSAGVGLGMAGGFIASQFGQAVGGLVGGVVLAGAKAITNARTILATNYICGFYNKNKTMPKAKIIAAGKYQSSTLSIGSSKGIDASVTVSFIGPGGKTIKHRQTLELDKDGSTTATNPEALITDKTFDGVSITEKISCGWWSWDIPVLLEKHTALVPVCDTTLAKEKLAYVAYVCIIGKCVPRKKAGLGWWNRKNAKINKKKIKNMIKKIREEYQESKSEEE